MACSKCGGTYGWKQTCPLISDYEQHENMKINLFACKTCGHFITAEAKRKGRKTIKGYARKIRGAIRRTHEETGRRIGDLPTMKDLKKEPLKTTLIEEKWYKDHKLSDKELVAYAKGCKEGKWKSFEELQKGVKND